MARDIGVENKVQGGGGTSFELFATEVDLIVQGINASVPFLTPIIAANTVLTFINDGFYGTVVAPCNGNITANLTGAIVGVTNTIIHNAASPPTLPAGFHKLSGSGDYVINVVNFIDCQYINSTLIRYSISQ